MKHKINPAVDCVFKAILGSEENKNLLINFLNAILEPKKGSLIADVTIQNPYNEREFIGDKLTIVDVKAVDENGQYYQIEIQLAIHAALSSRILYTWSSIYHSQIQDGDDYQKLKPVISIWLLDGNLFDDVEDCHIPFSLYNEKHKVVLSNHLAIHLLQLSKWKSKKTITTDKERWIYLFKEGKNVNWEKPPKTLKTEEMRQVMKVLHRFSENQNNYLLYQNRLEALLKENTYITSLEEAKKERELALQENKRVWQEKELALQEKAQALQEKAQALQENELVRQEKAQALQENELVRQEKAQALQVADREREQVQEKLNKALLLLKEKGINPNEV